MSADYMRIGLKRCCVEGLSVSAVVRKCRGSMLHTMNDRLFDVVVNVSYIA